MPIDNFIVVIDRLIDLVRAREARGRALFEDVVAPLFREFEPVAVDYVAMFRWARREIRDRPDEMMAHVVQELRDRREELLERRTKVREMASVFSEEVDDYQVRELAGQIRDFFAMSSADPARDPSSGLVILQFLEDLLGRNVIEELPRTQLVVFLRSLTVDLETRWKGVAQSYASLALNLKVPKQYRLRSKGRGSA